MKITRPFVGPRMMAGALCLSLPLLLPIQAHAAVGDPTACGNLPVLTTGSVTAGVLNATTDCPTGAGDQTRVTDRYALTLASPTTLTVGLTSADFQPTTGMRKAAATPAGFGPVLGTRAIAAMGLVNPQFALPAGDYTLFATTRLGHADTPPTGAYSFSIDAAAEPQVGCVPTRGATFVTFGSSAEAAISSADCTLPAREGVVAGDTPRYMDQYMMLMTGGQIAHLQVETDFDYRIEHWITKNGTSVMDGALPLVKANQEKLLTISDSVDATHAVLLVAVNPGVTGNYSVVFSDFLQNQREALISFYNSTNGANWTNKTNWLGAVGTECTWFGVTCEDGMVRTLNLDGNGLTGTIPSQLRMLSDLSILSLANNQLTGAIPAELGTLELSGLFLQNNQLSGAVPSALLTMSTLTASNYTGNTQLTQPLLNSSERTALLAFYSATGGDNWTNKTGWGGAVGTECSWYGITCIGGSVTAINFPTTLVANVPVGNGLVGTLPAALSGLPKLRNLSLAGNQLSGTIPAEIWQLTELRTLILGFNQLTGTLPPAVGNLTNLVNLLLYNNALTGPIPAEVGALSNLTSLQLFSNQFSGTIPAQLGNLTQMLNLNLRGNQLTGAIPVELGALTKMLFLSLGGNQLTGVIPKELGSLTNLGFLHLQDNQLTGQIPAELGNLAKLTTLNIPGNQLSGSIPPQIGNITTLTTIALQNNQLSGAIPASFATLPALTSIDVTGNKLDRNALVAFYNATGGDNWTNKTNWLGAPGTECTWYGVGCTNGVVTSLNFPANFSVTPPTGNNLVGTLPVELAMLTELRNLYLGVNQLSGPIPAELGTLSKLQTLSVFDNQLSGTIPAALGNLKELTLLGLASNNLTGTIPVELASLPKLQTLRLFDNQLTGTIPPELANLSQLQILEIQNNQLSGTVPPALAALASLTTFNYTGNTIIPFLMDANERTALMAFFNATGGANWTNKTGWGGAVGTECSWYGVGCSNGHVTTLNFPTTTVAGVRIGNNLSGTLPPEIGNLAELWQISLDGNELSGAIPSTIGNLKKLITIAMGHNNLSGEIPVEIGSLSALKQLYLYDNQLTGAIPAALGNLLNLDQLYLNNNQLSGAIPLALGNLTKLQQLHLNTNQLTGTIPGAIWQLTALKELSLERNQLSGVLPAEIGNLLQLTKLHLSDNSFSGPLPATIGNLTKLTSLILANNDFTGEIPASIGQLTELTHLSLPSNQLTGSIPGELANLTKLTSLYLNHNQLTGVTPAWISTLPLLVNLNLDGNLMIPALANPAERDALLAFYAATGGDNWTNKTGWGGAVGTECSWYGVRCSSGHVTAIDFPTAVVSGVVRGNGLVGTLPAEITTLTHLVTLKLNNNQLSGTIPSGLWNITSLTDLQLASNQLTGELPPAIGNLVNLRFLVLNGNQLSGVLPTEAANLTKLVNLSLSNVSVGGPIPAWIQDLGALTSLTLINAQLTGPIPDWIGNLVSLTFLNLNANELSGAIPSSIGNLVNLTSLNLNTNQLSGEIPTSIDKLIKLVSLQLYNNQLTGGIPSSIDKLVNLTSLNLYNNQLTGEIPASIGSLTKLLSLNLFNNQLSGGIPSSFGNLVNLTSFSLSGNQLTGEIPGSLGNLIKLNGLFLYNNQLSGPIPGDLAKMLNLRTLSLFGNQLSGTIPAELGSMSNLTTLSLNSNLLTGPVPLALMNLSELTTLGLADNQLTGGIPVEIGNLAKLKTLDLSGNQLSGAIPPVVATMAALTTINLAGNPLERNALVAFYNATGGESWTNNTNWLGAPGTECTWFGVGCTNGVVTSLNFPANLSVTPPTGNNLVGTLPVELAMLTELHTLYLAANQLSGTIPVELGALTKLKTLSVLGNQLSGTIPAELGNLKELTFLSLADNNLTGNIPVELGSLPKLQTLKLFDNQLTGTIPPELANLTQLQSLEIQNNQLSGTVPPALVALGSLTTFNYTGNTIIPFLVDANERTALMAFFSATGGDNWTNKTGWGGAVGTECSWYGISCTSGFVTSISFPSTLTAGIPVGNGLVGTLPAAVGSLTKLRTLALVGNQLSGPIPEEIWSLTELRNLSLAFNQLTGALPTAIGNLTKLTVLALNNNALTGTIPAEIGALTALTSLQLHLNQLNGELPTQLGNLTQLISLNLRGNQFTGVIPPQLGSLTKLTLLNLIGNQLTGVLPKELGNLVNLRFLLLGGNQLSGAIPQELEQLTKLEILLLNDNQLTGPVSDALYDMPLLTSLNLFGNTLDGLRVGDAAACENLTSVGLGEVVSGVLDRAADCFAPATQRLIDRYRLTLSEQSTVTLAASATDFQSLTGLAADSSPNTLVGSSGAQEETTATAQFLLPAGSWRLFSSTQQSNPHNPPFGAYSLSVTSSSEPQLGCMPSTFTVIGAVARGTLASGDCVGKPLPGENEGQMTRYMDSYAISLSAGDIAKVTLTADVDVRFEWWGDTAATDPVSSIPLTPAGQQAVFEVTANSAATHTLVVLAANHQATGTYTMTFTQGTAPEPEPEPEPAPEPTPVPVPDTGTGGTGGTGGSGTEGSGTGTGGSGTDGSGTGGTGTGGTPPEETPITQEELTESITSIEGALDAIDVVPGTAPSEETLTQVTNALDQADTLAQQLITALPEGTAGVTAALDALEVMNNTLSVTADVTQEGGVVSQDAVVNSLGNVADLLTSLSTRSDVITTEQQAAVQNLATSAVENSANLIVSTTTAEELVQLVSAVSDVINAAAQAGGTLTAELVDQAEALTSKAISTGLNQFSEGIDVTDSAAVASVLRSNPDALQFALEASVVLQSSSSGDSAAVESELAALGLSEEDSERLSANVLGSVANPDGVNVGGVSATDALINALSQLLSGATAQGLAQPAVAGLVAQALSDTEAKVQVNAATGVMTITLPGQKFYGAAVNIRLVPASVPEGISYMRDGRGVLVANGLAIELAPVSANVLAFASSVQKQGFAMTMRNNGAFSLNLGSGQRFSGTFAYDNLQAMTGTCAAPEFVTPQGAANDPGYLFGVRCEAGVEQRIAPFMEDPAFYQTASSGGLNVSTDRNTGIISITSVGRFKPSFFVNEPTEADKTWLAANKNANGVALRAVEINGDGIADFEFLSATGVQLLLGVRP